MGKGGSKDQGEGGGGSGGGKGKRSKRVMLLGSSESGKSTFAKQMQVLFGKGFDDDTRWHHKAIIAQNVCEILQETVDGLHKDELDTRCPVPIPEVQQLVQAALFEKRLSPDQIETAQKLWKDEEMNQYFHKYTTMPQIMTYFMPKLDTLEESPPTDQDIITCRELSSETSDTTYEVDGLSITLIDIGGRRGERKKWTPVFNKEQIDVVLFFASLSGYDEVLSEDMKTNRLQESLNLYKEIINHKHLVDAKIILVLSQVDRFREKIQNKSIDVCFSDYEGTNDFEESLDFVKKKFNKKFHGESLTPTPPNGHKSRHPKSPRPTGQNHLDCEKYVLVSSILDLTDIKKVAMAALDPDDFFSKEWSIAKRPEKQPGKDRKGKGKKGDKKENGKEN